MGISFFSLNNFCLIGSSFFKCIDCGLFRLKKTSFLNFFDAVSRFLNNEKTYSGLGSVPRPKFQVSRVSSRILVVGQWGENRAATKCPVFQSVPQKGVPYFEY